MKTGANRVESLSRRLSGRDREPVRPTPCRVASCGARWREWESFLRLRILASIIATMVTAIALAAERPPFTPDVLVKLASLVLIIIGAIIANQVLESDSDRLMPRTSYRPVAAGTINPGLALLLVIFATGIGFSILCFLHAWSLVVLSACSWILYVAVYTPVKRVSMLQTPIGAIVGATPVIMGAGILGQYFTPLTWILFAMMFFWQFPHAMAIAHLYRQEFSQAGIRVAPVADPSGRTTALFVVSGVVGLVATSVAAAVMGFIRIEIAVGLLLVTVYPLGYRCWQFLRNPSDTTSRGLLRATLVHLFSMMGVFFVCKWLG